MKTGALIRFSSKNLKALVNSLKVYFDLDNQNCR